MNLEKQINELYSNGNWEKCEIKIEKALLDEPNSFWYWTILSSVLYEQKRYEKARDCSEKALNINPDSPLVWWNYAGVLFMLDEIDKAIILWKRIIALGINEIGCVRTTQGENWAASLINDCRYHLGRALQINKDYLEAENYLKRYIEEIDKGVDTIFDKSMAVNLLNTARF